MNAKPIPIESAPAITRDAQVLKTDPEIPVKINIKGFNGIMSPILHMFPFYLNLNNNESDQQIALIFWLDQTNTTRVNISIAEKNSGIKEIIQQQPSTVLKWPPGEEGWLIPAQNISISPTQKIQIEGTLPHYFLLNIEGDSPLELDILIHQENEILFLLLVSIGLIIVANGAYLYQKLQTKKRKAKNE